MSEVCGAYHNKGNVVTQPGATGQIQASSELLNPDLPVHVVFLASSGGHEQEHQCLRFRKHWVSTSFQMSIFRNRKNFRRSHAADFSRKTVGNVRNCEFLTVLCGTRHLNLKRCTLRNRQFSRDAPTNRQNKALNGTVFLMHGTASSLCGNLARQALQASAEKLYVPR